MANLTEEQKKVVDKMRGSKSAKEWNDNCSDIKRTFDGYPDWWWEVIMMSGILAEAQLTYGWR